METRTGFLITQINQIKGRVFQRLLTESKVTEFNGPQGRILYVLWQEDAVPITRLVQQTGLAKNTLTSMLGRMEDAGLIARGASEQDGRKVIVRLTSKALGLQAKYDQVSEQMNQIFYQGMTQEDASTLDRLLERILANLQELQ